MAMYMGQIKKSSANQKYISLIYGVFTPVLNPLIYSLRNNDVKEGFWIFFTKYLTDSESIIHKKGNKGFSKIVEYHRN